MRHQRGVAGVPLPHLNGRGSEGAALHPNRAASIQYMGGAE